MRIHFLFPSNPLKASAIEEMFEDQARALAAAGFTVSVCPDSVVQRARPLRDVPPGATVVYRGWMLNAAEYGRLAEAITTAGAAPFTTPATYLAAHHLPNWYPLIKEFTPETRVLPAGADPEAELRALGWDAFFLKDYVKSLKTSRGSIIRNPSDVWGVIREMEQFRGEIEGGLCVRRVEDSIPSPNAATSCSTAAPTLPMAAPCLTSWRASPGASPRSSFPSTSSGAPMESCESSKSATARCPTSSAGPQTPSRRCGLLGELSTDAPGRGFFRVHTDLREESFLTTYRLFLKIAYSPTWEKYRKLENRSNFS